MGRVTYLFSYAVPHNDINNMTPLSPAISDISRFLTNSIVF